ncbi:MAG: PorP/SprF family type IX secretion system membrane protein [Bacteroidales bacterium]|nr:PorP/SprF family type IX secretion system membrane protein [Bacteroidales bacterium]
MKKSLLLILLCLIISSKLRAQDPQFTQFYANKLYLAPSFAGATQMDRVSSSYRNQWPSLPGIFVSYSFSYDHYFSNFNSGVGLLVMRDLAGTGELATTSIGLQYSYDFKINNWWHVRPGAQLSFVQTSMDFQKLIWNDQISVGSTGSTSIEQPPLSSKADIDFTASVLAYSKKHWIGLTIDHLLKPKNSLWDTEEYIPLKFSVFGGTQIIRRGNLLSNIDESLSAAFLFRNQYFINQLDIGLYWFKEPIVLGFWYRGIPIINEERLGDAVAVLAGYKIDDLSVGYSYDFTISNLIGSTGGAHEISLTYEFSTTRKRQKRHMIPCPQF